MKALSIRQPWAWLIVNGHKHIENRTWSTRHRGPMLIHASKGMTGREYDEAMEFALTVGFRSYFPQRDELERGGIVGIADLRACIPPAMRTSPWHIEGCHGFALFDARPLSFVECKGALGFFECPVTL